MREIYFLLRLSFLLVTISCTKGKDKKNNATKPTDKSANHYWQHSDEEFSLIISITNESNIWEFCLVDINGEEKHIEYVNTNYLHKIDFKTKDSLEIKPSQKKPLLTFTPTTKEEYELCKSSIKKFIVKDYFRNTKDNMYARIIINASDANFKKDITTKSIDICDADPSNQNKDPMKSLDPTYTGKPSIDIQNNNEIISISYPGGAQLVKIDNGEAIFESCKNTRGHTK